MARPRKQKNKAVRSNTLRIIGGQWRSRKLPFPDFPGLRPTPDRIRETLFNWLQADIHGARCLDLFAGSGALGFEALSRGAAKVVFIDSQKAAASQLQQNLALLEVDSGSATVCQLDAKTYLQNQANMYAPFDIVFLDPPYRKGLLDDALQLIHEKSLITKNSLIYLEHESEESYRWEDYGLSILKEAQAGQVKSFLMGVSS